MHETVFLVRHGHVEGVDVPRFRGREHMQLTEAGLRQARQTAAYLHRIARVESVISSPLTRCITTASAIGQPLGLAPVPVEGLIERDYGDWQGRSLADIQGQDPAHAAAWLEDPTSDVPNGEAFATMAARVAAAFDQIVEQHRAQTFVIVAHETVNRLLLLRALGLGPGCLGCLAQAPGAVSKLCHDGVRWIVDSMNETAHLVPALGGST